MLISITEKCRMGCSHCIDDARSDSNKFMDRETFEKAIDFNLKYDNSITITGGEPTEHPQFWEYMDYISHKIESKNNFVVSILTNGMNLSDADIPKIEQLNKMGHFLFQVSSIKPYYPIAIDLNQKVFHLPNVFISSKLEILQPMGRAKTLKKSSITAKAPNCFNTRSVMRGQKDFHKSIIYLRSIGRFCCPQISYDGHIKVGESTLCPAVAHINDSEKEIISKICAFKCDGCKELLQGLPPLYRHAIGEQ